MTTDLRKEAIDVLRRFVRGEATDDEVEEVARELDVTGMGGICETLAFSLTDFLQLEPEPHDLARQIGRCLRGHIRPDGLGLWAAQLQGMVSSPVYEAAGVSKPVLRNVLSILSLLSDPAYSIPGGNLRACLRLLHGWLLDGRPSPLRRFLPIVFQSMARLRLCIVENPLRFSNDIRPHWVDVGLLSGEDVRLIPFSVFTRSFFGEELPGLLSSLCGQGPADCARRDDFCYHPENDQAISLRERFPAVRRAHLTFQYFVDESGLGEIVLESDSIGRSEVLFAARLFCLQNCVRRATLDGRRVSCVAAAL